jgi:UDPglucose--hexose-1-phosphate uridylyltransferase
VSTETIWKASRRLSDGREIVYFDESPDTGRASVADTRNLPAPAFAPPEIRQDPFTGESIVIAAQRQDRTYHPAEKDCPLDPSTADRATEIPASSYDVVVFENRFPSLRKPHGRCEVMCFTSVHDASFASLPPQRVNTVMAAWIDRTVTLGELPEVQIDAALKRELDDDVRIVARNEHWVAFVPHAARWPFEVRIFPLARVPQLPVLSKEQQEAFGPVYLKVLRGLDRLFGLPMPYIAAWHQAPGRDEAARERFAAHLQVFSVRRAADKLKYLAGTESGMGVWINDIVPEEAARRLREAV